MLKLDDIVALAKQGYKPADVKELIELSKEADKEPEPEEKTSDDKPEEEPTETVAKPEEKPSAEPEEASKVVDYKKKVEELEAKLSELQKANTRKNIADTDEKSDSDVVAEAMKSFM